MNVSISIDLTYQDHRHITNYDKKMSMYDIILLIHPKYIPLLNIADTVDKKLHYFISIRFNYDKYYCIKSKYFPNFQFINDDNFFAKDIKEKVKKIVLKQIYSICVFIVRNENINETMIHFIKRGYKNQSSNICCKYCFAFENPIHGKKFKRCNRCHNDNIRYCSRECQIADWENHKEDCMDQGGIPP